MTAGATATAAFQSHWPSTARVQPRTRVWGSDLASEAASASSCASSSRTRWASTCTHGRTASVRPIVTNLRLPGQYDERLLGPVGLQGPYYNWNRWYLPGVGRYLEPDPIAMAGGFNTPYGVDWYGYALQNPLRWADPEGLAACTYSISFGTLQCTPDDPNAPILSIACASGNNNGGVQCKNNPACKYLHNRGPLPPGRWCWNVNGPGWQNTKPGGRRLVPQPGTQTYNRTSFLTHSCLNPFGPSLNPPFCSEGCITCSATSIQKLNNLLAAEPDSCVEVTQ